MISSSMTMFAINERSRIPQREFNDLVDPTSARPESDQPSSAPITSDPNLIREPSQRSNLADRANFTF